MQQNTDQTQIQIRLIQSEHLCHDAEKEVEGNRTNFVSTILLHKMRGMQDNITHN